MLVNGTLANRANAGFEPTPPRYAQLIAQHILAFTPQQLRPGEAYTILEPCIGVGDLAAPVVGLPGVQLYAVEQDPERGGLAIALPHCDHPHRGSGECADDAGVNDVGAV
jgi:hypothetical protein